MLWGEYCHLQETRPAETLKYDPQGNGAFAGIVRVKTADELTQVGGRPQVRRARLGERRRPGGREEGGVSAGTGHAAQGTWRHREPGDRHGGSSPGACAAQPPAGDLQPGPRPRPVERGARPTAVSRLPAAGSPRKPCGSLVYTCAAGGHGSSSPPLPSPLPLASELGEEAGKPSFGR